MAKNCPKCEKENPNVANFCLFCGYSFSGKKTPQIVELEKKIEEQEKKIITQINEIAQLNFNIKKYKVDIYSLEQKIIRKEKEETPDVEKDVTTEQAPVKSESGSGVKKQILMISILVLAGIATWGFFSYPPSKEIHYRNGTYIGQIKNEKTKHGKGKFVFNENNGYLRNVVLKGKWVDGNKQGKFTAEKEGKIFTGILKDGAGELTADDGETLNISQYD